jgi:hypothetical protein
MRLTATLAVVGLLVAIPATAQPANSCSDPYWQHTLRCALSPTQAPQPNLDQEPLTPSDIKPYTRIFLDDDINIRCMDGTAPLMYVDKAICTNRDGCGPGTRYGEPIESNKWMFTMPGGGSCHGEFCGPIYGDPAERGEMSSATKPPMKEMEGIHLPDPEKNPVFAGYNRVRVEKCSYDRYMGRGSQESPGGFFEMKRPDGSSVRYNVYYHGFRMLEKAFEVLENGLHYSTWKTNEPVGRRRACCSVPGGTHSSAAGDKVIRAEEKLPPLAEAEVVLFVGHSGACHGLFQNIDNLAARLAVIPGFTADVRAMFDENFIPAAENEAAFASTASPGSDAYSGIATGSSASSGGPFTYDAAAHFTTDITVQQYAAWRAVVDTSCTELHGATDPWRCNDRHHVLLNHIGTPFLLRQDFLDQNTEHLDGGRGHLVRWADEANYAHCTGGKPCDPRFTAAEFRSRLEKQIETFLTLASTRSEIGKGLDRTFATPGTLPTSYVWMPQCAKHDGAYDNDSFYNATMAAGSSSYSMRQWVEEFMTAPRLGTKKSLVDGVNGATTTKCK